MKIIKVNETYLKVDCDRSVASELSDYFSFHAPNYFFHPKYKLKIWDGKIRLFNLKTYQIYLGLLPHIQKFCTNNDYNIEYLDPSLYARNYDVEKAVDYIKNLKICDRNGDRIKIRKYQFEAIGKGILNPRLLLHSPTNSGKSLIIYAWLRWFQHIGLNKHLIIVPTINLVNQLYNDFKEYSSDDEWNVEDHCHKIMGGKEKNSDKTIYISTWQSIYKMGQKYFDQFQVLLVDEAHEAEGASLKSIAEKTINCPVKFGTTGTVKEAKAHQFVLEGLFGKIYKTISTKEMIDMNFASKLKIKCIILEYPEKEKKLVKKDYKKYQEEIDYIINHDKRSQFISNLVNNLKNNTMTLYYRISHGEKLFEQIKEKSEKQTFFIGGGTKSDEREEIRQKTFKKDSFNLVASTGVFSTGTNIPNLQNLVFAHPYKSEVKNLQSIGRILRLDDKDNKALLYDIVDDLSWKKRKNFALNHFENRLKIYDKEQFDYEIIRVKLSDSGIK